MKAGVVVALSPNPVKEGTEVLSPKGFGREESAGLSLKGFGVDESAGLSPKLVNGEGFA